MIASLLALVAVTAPLRIDLRGPHADAIEALLLPEIEFVRTSSAPNLWVDLSPEGAELRLSMEGKNTPRSERRLGSEAQPAVRMAALLAARAARTEAALAVEVAPPPLPPLFVVRVEAGFGSTFWTSPLSPQLGPTLAVRVRFSGYELGLWAGLFGPVCCEKRVEPVISGDALEVPVLVEGLVQLLRPTSWFRFLVGIGAGLDVVRLTARPDAFAGPGLPQTETYLQGLLRADLGAELRISKRFWVNLRAGGQLRFPRRLTRLQPEEIYGSGVLETGPIGPWAELQLAIDIL